MGRIALVAALALALGLLAWQHRRAEAAEGRLAAIASEVAGRDVGVSCQGRMGAVLDVSAEAGAVEFDADGRPADSTELKRGICTALERFPHERLRPEFRCLERDERCPQHVVASAWAVQTLAHESWHLRGERDEARTECFGLQTTAYVAGRLGAHAFQAQALALYLYKHVYPGMPQHYRSVECRDGGSLDLRPDSAVWP
ncbi:MAG: hypothetical protein ACRDN6_04410 [Gaiellaceae bacterium]